MPYVHRLQTFARWVLLTVAVVMGGDDADVSLADGLSFGVGGAGAFMLLVSAAAAQTAVTGQSSMSLQAIAPAHPGGSLTGLFQSGGWLGGFAAGFLGCGLLGILFGRGLVGQLGSIPSYFGLIFQLALWAMLCRLIWTRWRGGDAGGPGTLSPRQLAAPYLRSRDDLHFHGGRHQSARGYDADPPDSEAHSVCSSDATDPGGGRG